MKRRIILASLLALSIAAAIIAFAFSSANKSARMSSDQINALRSQYPLIESDLDIPMFALKERIKSSMILAEIEFVGQLPDYHVTLSENGKTEDLLFHQFKAKVLNAYINQDNDTFSESFIVISYADVFSNSFPKYEIGLKAIISLESASGPHAGKYILSGKTFYYITDDMHVLSAYEELPNDDHSGYTLTELNNIIREAVKSLDD